MQKLPSRLFALLLFLLLVPEVQAQQPPVRRPPLPARLQGQTPGDRQLRPGEVPRRELPPRGARTEDEEEERRPSRSSEERPPSRSAEERSSDRRAAVNAGQGKFKLDFDGADITEVIRAISDMTGRNFILPDNVRGKVTILSPTAVTPDEAYAAFLAALEANNLAVYPVGKFLKVIPKKEAQRANIPTSVDPDGFYPWNEQMVTKLFRLEHIEVDGVNNVVKGLVSRDGEVQTIPPDLLIVTDVGLNLHRIERIMKQIDQSGGADEIRILQVRYAAAPQIAETLMQIFEGEGGGAARTPAPTSRTRRARRAAQQAQTPEQQNELEVAISRVIPDERTNKLIVIADQRSFRRIEDILAQLDVPTEGEGQVHVHYLDNANAEELASTLSQLAQGTSDTSRAGRPTPARARNARNGADAGGETTAELFEGELRITADKATNSLVVISSYNDYKALARVIEKLDIPRRMVFVEAVIMEVSLDTSTEFGLSFHQGAAPEIGGDVAPVILGTQVGGLNSLSLGSLLSFGGFLAGIQGPAIEGTEGLGTAVPSFGVVLQALQRDSRVNVLSTPHLLTADNEEAEITVGQNVPFQAGFAPSGISSLLNQGTTGTNGTNQNQISPGLAGLSSGVGLSSFFAPIQRQNVELRLKIKPQINESDLVRLVIEEQTEEIIATDRQLGPTTARRTAKTTVVARDGRTVVIGGLIQERDVESVQKVPVLGDIPVLGWLFRSNETKTIKTNLLLFLTPYIIKSEADFQRIFERKLEEREDFVEQFYGISSYQSEVDFGRKVGPLTQIQKTLEEARMAPENGGPGKDVKVFTPSMPPPAAPEVEGPPAPPTDREAESLGGTRAGEDAGDTDEEQEPKPEEALE